MHEPLPTVQGPGAPRGGSGSADEVDGEAPAPHPGLREQDAMSASHEESLAAATFNAEHASGMSASFEDNSSCHSRISLAPAVLTPRPPTEAEARFQQQLASTRANDERLRQSLRARQ